MTTWTNTAISKTKTAYLGTLVLKVYKISGVSGDTGGTLTTSGIKDIYYAGVVGRHSAALGSTTIRTTANTVVVTYTDPTATHTVEILVIGQKG